MQRSDFAARLAGLGSWLALAGAVVGADAPGGRLAAVPVGQVTIDDEFWAPRLKVWREVTIPDCLAKFEKDGAVRNFKRVRDGQLTGRHDGPPWFDGLLYEMIRGGADFLATRRDPALEKRLDGYIAVIAAAQARDPDGYLNTYTQTERPSQRWGRNGGDDNHQHDVYNAGALIEAGVHYYRATGKTALLKAGVRLANHMCNVMGPPPRSNVVPGHSLAEEALVRLYELFREQPGLKNDMGVPVDEGRYLKLAEFFIEARGHAEGRRSFGAYGQDHRPVFEQPSIEGHAVRATLMGTGVAALAAANGRPEYAQAARRLWASMADRKTYITGGCGATAEGEAFGPDYALPNDGYLETCAAVGSGFFSRAMNLAFAEGRYADELERVLYNGALGGVSRSGDRYAYVNPLSFRRGHARWAWHGCPCCPPMFLKLMGALPGYVYARDAKGVTVNLFVGSRAEVRLPAGKVTLRQTTRYPWEGDVRIAVAPERPAVFEVRVRVPGWCQGAAGADDLYRVEGRPAAGAVRVTINGQPVAEPVRGGYITLSRRWQAGDAIGVALDMPVRRVKAHPRVEAAAGRVALVRGPLVYCAEGTDHEGSVGHLVLPPGADLRAEHRADLLGGVTAVRGRATGLFRKPGGGVEQKPVDLTAVPYFAYGNREPDDLLVWLPESAAAAQPRPVPTLAGRARASASHCWRNDTLDALNDGVEPAASDDTKIPRFTWWDRKGTAEWVQYDFDRPERVSAVAVYWWDERRIQAHCRVPASWRVLVRDGTEWKPVAGASGHGTEMDLFNRVTYSPVTTTGVRIEVRLQEGWSGGILEWTVE